MKIHAMKTHAHCLLAAAMLIHSGAVAATAQDATPQRIQYANPMGELLPWLHSRQMEQELEIVAEQKEALAKLQKQTMEDMNKLYKEAQTGDQRDVTKRYYELSAAMGADTDKRVKAILLPGQIRRLRQIALQMKLGGAAYGHVDGLINGFVADELQLTEAQKRQLKEKQKEITADIQRKTQEFYKELRESSHQELLSVLTPEQRKKLDDLTGEKFEWKAEIPQSQPKPAAPKEEQPSPKS
jgi:Spy/CpxP family protein refolding chaperone